MDLYMNEEWGSNETQRNEILTFWRRATKNGRLFSFTARNFYQFFQLITKQSQCFFISYCLHSVKFRFVPSDPKKKQWISLKNHQNLIMLGSWAFFCFFVKLQINLLDIANCLCKIALVRIPAVEGFLVWNFMWNSKMAFAWKFTILCNILAQRMACQATMSWSCFLWNRIKIISESNSIFDTNMQKEIFMIGNMIILVDFWKLFTLYSVTKYSFVFLS